jgi:hypothetical protein
MLYLPGLLNVVTDFLSCPFLSPQATGDVNAAAVAPRSTSRRCCVGTQRLHGRTSLTITFQQAGKHCLVGDVSTSIFRPESPKSFNKVFFSYAQYHTQGGLLPFALFHLCMSGAAIVGHCYIKM